MIKNRNNIWVAGVDGCPGGWLVVLKPVGGGVPVASVANTFQAVLDCPEEPEVIAIDMPIGLLDEAIPGGRACDLEARTLLKARARSVFSPPVWGALSADTYQGALRANRDSSPHGVGISKQCFNLSPKIKEINTYITPESQARVKEIHPELSFFGLNGGSPMPTSKHSEAGIHLREQLLNQLGFAALICSALAGATALRGAQKHDLLDACAACWTAERIVAQTAIRIPEPPPRDSRGLLMEMWY